MGRRIPLAVEIPVVGGDDFVQPHEDVLSHMGIGVFIEGDPCRRVRNIEDTEATSHPRLFNNLFYLPGDVNQLALLRSRYTEGVDHPDSSPQLAKNHPRSQYGLRYSKRIWLRNFNVTSSNLFVNRRMFLKHRIIYNTAPICPQVFRKSKELTSLGEKV
jgi:hypothetical protein